MNSFKKFISFLILPLCYFSLLSFSTIDNAINLKINNQKLDTIIPNVTTYSKLKNFDKNNGYFKNKNSNNANITTYSKLHNFDKNNGYFKNKSDNNSSVTTYSKISRFNTKYKKRDNSSSVTTYSKLNNYQNKTTYPLLKAKKIVKRKIVTKSKKVITNSTSVNKSERIFIKEIVKPTVKVYKKRRTYPSIKVKKKPKRQIVKNSSNVTTYSQLPKKNVPKYKYKNHQQKFTSNVTTYSKLPKERKLKNKKISKITQNQAKPNYINQVIYNSSNETKIIRHGIPALDNANNISAVETMPLFPGCESSQTNKAKKDCLYNGITKFVYTKFNTSLAKKFGASKGFNEIRVLIVIDENGNSKAIKTTGKWDNNIVNEAKRVIKSLPKMIPGKKNGQSTSVKYSFKIPFIVE